MDLHEECAVGGDGDFGARVDADTAGVVVAGDGVAGGVVDFKCGVEGGADAAGFNFDDECLAGLAFEAIPVAIGALQSAVDGGGKGDGLGASIPIRPR